ncbi:MAG: YbaK/EbsC family protein [FCB group bacterium]|nr:YbaK/EbsC family protein [FCB group bacterium]
MPAEKLRKYLDDNNVKYRTIIHSRAFTAQEVAAKAKIPGKELAKTVIVRVGSSLAMAVLPASLRVDFQLLQDVVGANDVELATENEFKEVFPDCEIGAMPPFGNLYGVDVFVAERLTDDEEIAFNACSHTELIKMAYSDFARLVQPKVVRFSTG